jgi:chromosome segregation ATPase|tara:strand:- start:1345 stop:1599 length:255 start_codon:yes stop_codon:yes gene_type:complete
MLKNLRRKAKHLNDRVDQMYLQGEINIRSLPDIKELYQQIDKLKQDLADKQTDIDVYKALLTKVNSEKDTLKKQMQEIRLIIGS